jgi:pimeloyl-ACP methyl ester carboxylesterase
MLAEFDSLAAPDYAEADGWLPLEPREAGPNDLFYLHPTVDTGPGWFGDPFDHATDAAAEAVAESQASAFPGRVWAPRYRHASSRAFRALGGEGDAAYALGYRDVERAFAAFIRSTGDRPFILAGHSQGARHVLSLLAERIAGTPVAERLVAAYAIGVGVARDGFGERFPGLTLLGPPGQSGCVLSWNSYLEGADPAALLARTPGPIACVNPLSFDERAPIATGARVTARSDGGVLFVEPHAPGALDGASLPGGNLHPVDIELFRDSIRADATLRVESHRGGRA